MANPIAVNHCTWPPAVVNARAARGRDSGPQHAFLLPVPFFGM